MWQRGGGRTCGCVEGRQSEEEDRCARAARGGIAAAGRPSLSLSLSFHLSLSLSLSLSRSLSHSLLLSLSLFLQMLLAKAAANQEQKQLKAHADKVALWAQQYMSDEYLQQLGSVLSDTGAGVC